MQFKEIGYTIGMGALKLYNELLLIDIATVIL